MKNLIRNTSLGAAVVLMAACNSDGIGPNPALSPMLNRDVAQVAADIVGEDVDLMTDQALGDGPMGFFSVASDEFAMRDCPFVNGRFECPPVTRGPLTFLRSFAFFDAQGGAQEAFDPLTTASANFVTSVEGEVSRDAWSASVSRDRDRTVSGLVGEETTRTWNGTGSGEISRSRHTDGEEARTYEMEYTSSTSNVVVGVPRADNPWPLSGTVTKNVTVTITGGPRDGTTATRTVVVTFNGTQFVTATVNGETFEIDLGNHRVRGGGR